MKKFNKEGSFVGPIIDNDKATGVVTFQVIQNEGNYFKIYINKHWIFNSNIELEKNNNVHYVIRFFEDSTYKNFLDKEKLKVGEQVYVQRKTPNHNGPG